MYMGYISHIQLLPISLGFGFVSNSKLFAGIDSDSYRNEKAGFAQIVFVLLSTQNGGIHKKKSSCQYSPNTGTLGETLYSQ